MHQAEAAQLLRSAFRLGPHRSAGLGGGAVPDARL